VEAFFEWYQIWYQSELACLFSSSTRSLTDMRRLGVGEPQPQPQGEPQHQPLPQPHRQRITSGSPFESRIGFSRALRVDDRVWVSGTGPVWPDGSCPDEPGPQARRCFDIILAALAEAGAGIEDVVRTRMFLTSAADADAVSAVHGELFGDIRPAATMVVIAALLDPRWKVEIEAEAVIAPEA